MNSLLLQTENNQRHHHRMAQQLPSPPAYNPVESKSGAINGDTPQYVTNNYGESSPLIAAAILEAARLQIGLLSTTLFFLMILFDVA